MEPDNSSDLVSNEKMAYKDIIIYQAANQDVLKPPKVAYKLNLQPIPQIDHFADTLHFKEEQVKELYEKLADYQKQYSSLRRQNYRLLQEWTLFQTGKKKPAPEDGAKHSSEGSQTAEKTLIGAPAPGISKQLFDSVIEENIRLQKDRQHLIESKGIDFKGYMESDHLERVIEKLRKELRAKEKQTVELQESLKRALATKPPQPQQGGPVPPTQVVNEKTQQIYPQLVTALAQKNLALVQEKKELSERNQYLEAQLNSKESQSAEENEKDSIDHGKNINELKENLLYFQQESQKYQNSLSLMKEVSEAKVNELQQKIKSTVEENHALKTQLHIFKEDWEKENAEKTDLEKLKVKQNHQLQEMKSQLDTVGVEKSHLELSNLELEKENRQLHTMMPGFSHSMSEPSPAAYSSYGFEQKRPHLPYQTAQLHQEWSAYSGGGGGGGGFGGWSRLSPNVVADGPFGGRRHMADSSETDMGSPGHSGPFRGGRHNTASDSSGIEMSSPSNSGSFRDSRNLGASPAKEAGTPGNTDLTVADSSGAEMGGAALGGGEESERERRSSAEPPRVSECPRCQREFTAEQHEEFEEHVDKCLNS